MRYLILVATSLLLFKDAFADMPEKAMDIQLTHAEALQSRLQIAEQALEINQKMYVRIANLVATGAREANALLTHKLELDRAQVLVQGIKDQIAGNQNGICQAWIRREELVAEDRLAYYNQGLEFRKQHGKKIITDHELDQRQLEYLEAKLEVEETRDFCTTSD